MGRTAIIAVLVLFVVACSSASAQIIGPGPKQGRLQVGGWWAFLTYDVSGHIYYVDGRDYENEDVKQDRAGLTLRYGATDDLYLLLNFGLLHKQFRFERDIDFRDTIDYNALEGVLGIGGNVLLKRVRKYSVRLGAEYNDVFQVETDGEFPPWQSRDLRMVLDVDRTVRSGHAAVTYAAAIVYFNSREKLYTRFGGQQLVRAGNVDKFAPAASLVISAFDRVNLGLELTFGAITDFRWRTEIQL